MIRTVFVDLPQRAYRVEIGAGLIDQAGQLIAPLLKTRRTAIVTDSNVWSLHGARLTAALEAAGIQCPAIVMPPGEQTKSFEGLAEVCDRLLALELDRGDLILAFGGGVIGDLAGFAASVYKRGIDFVQIPTTLLAQVDSSVGGKTAIDTPRGKNLIGAFHQPRLVLADLDVLDTLDDRQMRAGYAEVIKYGLLGDFAFFTWLEARGGEVLHRDREALVHAVGRSVEMKAEIVIEDEKEAGRRALLNLGHTFGHALEIAIGFGDELLHGEAVAAGCCLAYRFAADQGLCSRQDAVRAQQAIASVGLPTRFAEITSKGLFAHELVAHMGQDKKAQAGMLTFILPRALGDSFVARDVDPAAVKAFLIAEGANP